MTTSEVSLRSLPRLAARSYDIDGRLDLLDCYAPDGFAWIDGDHGFVASGVAAVVAPADAPSFLSTIRHWPADARVPDAAGPRAVGALPFTGSGVRLVDRTRSPRGSGNSKPPASRLGDDSFAVASSTPSVWQPKQP